MGNAIMSFYSALIDLLGRCAPEMHVRLMESVYFQVFLSLDDFSLFSLPFYFLQLINKGKGEALRIRAILRSLVPTEDLVGIISIPLKMPITNKGARPILYHAATGCLGYESLHIRCTVKGYWFQFTAHAFLISATLYCT